jgi:hypothetical protein
VVPTNILYRVFQLKCGGSAGTMFALDFDERQYIITATHLLDAWSEGSPVEIHHNGAWQELPVTVVGRTTEELDVTVLAARQPMCPPGFPAEPTLADIILGQDVHFVDFPFGWRGPSTELLRRAPLPFVKRACLSMLDMEHDLMFLDGINNVGFSGAPVFFQPRGDTKTWSIAGVVTGYHDVAGFVSANDEETALTYYSNSGLIYVAPIKKVVDVIKANPTGVPVR